MASQATENSAISSTDITTSIVTAPVITIAGLQDVSRQLVDRTLPGIDEVLALDLMAAYAAELDRQVIAGTGASNQHLGILNTAGTTQEAAFAVSLALPSGANVALFYSKLAAAVGDVNATRFLPADTIVMHPRRWAWLSAAVDSQNRPLMVPNGSGPNNAMCTGAAGATNGPVGQIFGIDVVISANVPTNVGSGPEDVVIVARMADVALLEAGDGMPTQVRYDAPLANQLTVRLVAFGYSAFTAARQPKAIAKVGGTATVGNGLITPTL